MAHAKALQFESNELEVHAGNYRFADFSVNRQTDTHLYKNAYMTLDTYGQRLKSARQAAKLTQEQLALKAGLRQGTISELENDNYAGSSKTAELAEALGIDALWLAQGIGDRVVGSGVIGASSASLASAVVAASPAAKEAIRAILRADLAGESPEALKLILRLFPENDVPGKLER